MGIELTLLVVTSGLAIGSFLQSWHVHLLAKRIEALESRTPAKEKP